MPNKKDTVLINGEVVAKRHLLCSKREAFSRFMELHPEFPRKFTTFRKMVPKNFKPLNLSCRQVCVCIKDYNLEQKVNALNQLGTTLDVETKISVRDLSDLSLCKYIEFPERKCSDRDCNNCGIYSVVNWYEPLITKSSTTCNQIVKYHQWETTSEQYEDRKGIKKRTNRWIQVQKKQPVSDVVKEVSRMEQFSSHSFRSNFQQRVQSNIINELPMDHCLVVMDFSENLSLQPQDEIESAHWNIKQVTIHPIYIVRHALESTIQKPVVQKESLIVISDSLAHDTDAVQVFTDKLVVHLNHSPGPCKVKVIHRFSDNCAGQYKSKLAFMNIGLIEKKHDIRLVYHYTESGHGKGPSDGLGAAIKRKIDRLIIAGNVINNAYQAYLALQQNESDKIIQKIIYVPKKVIKHLKPEKPGLVKTLPGTQSFHCVKTFGAGML